MDERTKRELAQNIRLIFVLADVGREISARLQSIPAEQLPPEIAEVIARLKQEATQGNRG